MHACVAVPPALTGRFPRAPQEHIDYYSVQALLFEKKRLSLYQETKLFFKYYKRITD